MSASFETDAAQRFVVILSGVVAIQCDGLVADDAARTIRRGRIEAVRMKVRLGAGDEEGTCLVQHIQAREIDVAAIHDVDGTRFREQQGPERGRRAACRQKRG